MGVVLLLSGCGLLDRPGPVVDLPSGPPATVHAGWPGCLRIGAFAQWAENPPDHGRGTVPNGFVTRTVVLCTVRDDPGATPIEDQRTAATGFEQHADDPADVQKVIDYVALPSQTQPDPGHVACPAIGELEPWLFLVDDADRWIRPEFPRDTCGFTRGFRDGTPSPVQTLRYTDTPVCRVPVGTGEWTCEPL